MKTTPFTLSVQATALHFAFTPDSPHRYVVLCEQESPIEFYYLYPHTDQHHYRQATGVEIDGTEEFYFIVCVQGSMEPPIAIVNAANMSEAEEKFVNVLPWAHLDEAAARDREESTCQEYLNEQGIPYDGEAIGIHQVHLVHVELAVSPTYDAG